MKEFEKLRLIKVIHEQRNIIYLILFLRKLKRILLLEELIDDYETLKGYERLLLMIQTLLI